MIDPSFLGRVELFADLPGRDLDFLSRRMSRRHYGKGRLVFMKGEPGTALYVVQEGQVKIVVTSEQGDELILRVLGPGDTFGELALLDGAIRWTDAVAQNGSVLLVLEREDFLPYVKSRPEVATRLVSLLGFWLQKLAELAENEAFLDVQARLAKALLELCRADSRLGEEDCVTCPRVTQTDLAGMAGTSRRSVNKWLAFYQRNGIIRFENGFITLLRPELLRRRAS